MNKSIIITGIVLFTMIISSCVKDLDVKPLDKDVILSGNLSDSAIYMEQALGKIYASFMIPGQGANNGGDDITSSDGNFFTTMRAFWNCQEITTDEAICGWGDVGIADLNTQTWSPTNPFITALYQRLGLSITYANDFIQLTNGSSDPKIKRYNAEARFLRALAYYWYLDLYGNPPFTTDKDGVGKFFPKQIKRADLFKYVEDELHAIQGILGEPGFSYPQADQGACWMLLAKLYLNAEVYTGTAKWDSCVEYCNKVINSGAYSLATDYRQNFSADNDGYHNPEMIFAWEQDGVFTQGYVGTTFIIQSSSDPRFLNASTLHDLPSNPNWNGNRMRIQFLDRLIDTLKTYGNVPIPFEWDTVYIKNKPYQVFSATTDSMFSAAGDSRMLLKMKRSMDIPSSNSSGDYGIGVYKFTGRNTDGSRAESYNPAYASTDFPIFRLAEAYLMRAEALFRLGDAANAVKDINVIRERGYGNTLNNITVADLDEDFILDELGREFYFEAHRRTDLVRFGQFTDGDYVWVWKGGTYAGQKTSSHLNLFPIPGDEVSSNPNIEQNEGYK